MAARIREAGEFCWVNMITPRPEEAMAFFGAVLGWTFFEMPGMGHGMRVGGRDVGGLFDQDGPGTPPGTPAYIGVMIKVDDADACAAKIAALGGRARPAFDIGEQGRMAVCFDPTGAEFDVWESRKMLGTDVDPSRHGAPSWFEAMTADAERASAFYAGLFGWSPESMPMPGAAYTTFKRGGELVAGMMAITPEMAGLKPHWATYFTVDDPDEAARKAVELGGTLRVPPQDIPGVGRFAAIVSPQGVAFSVIRYLPQ